MIERSINYRRIKKLVKWPLIISNKFFYLIDKETDIDRGLWSFEPWGKGLRIHSDMKEDFKGKEAIESAKEAFRWIFKNTGAEFIRAEISRENMKACFVASWSGMKSLGVKDNVRAFRIMR